MFVKFFWRMAACLALLGCVAGPFDASGEAIRTNAAQSVRGIRWAPGADRISADVQNWPLNRVLEEVSAKSGWSIYVEPGLTQRISAKFQDVPVGQGLNLLLGKLGFALVPSGTAPGRLFVFQTSRENATQRIEPKSEIGSAARRVPRELIVKLRPGADIENVIKKLGGTVVGKLDGQDYYRVRFDDESTADAARELLASDSDVETVENNFYVDRPPDPRQAGFSSVPPVSLQLRPPEGDGRVVIGLVDTAVQKLGDNLDAFLLKAISVAGESALDPLNPSHGTSMAETILRSLQHRTGGSTSVQILPVDIYGPNSATTTFDVAAGIVAAVNGGATLINLSLGSPSESAFLKSLIQEVHGKNIPVFAAAGNEPVTTPFYPAAYPEVFAVTATDRGRIADYANRGEFVDMGAPGTSVIYFNGRPYHVVGTSAASAYASGTGAAFMESTSTDLSKLQEYIKNNLAVEIPTGDAGK